MALQFFDRVVEIVGKADTRGDLIQRLGDCAARPLLRDLDSTARAVRLNELLENRQAAYLSADHVVDTDDLAVGSVVDEIARRLAAAAGPPGAAA